MKEVKEALKASGREVCTAVNVGMEGEALYRTVEEIPDDAGYFSLIIAKEAGGKNTRDRKDPE